MTHRYFLENPKRSRLSGFPRTWKLPLLLVMIHGGLLRDTAIIMIRILTSTILDRTVAQDNVYEG